MVLAEAPDGEEGIKISLLVALKELKDSPEATVVATTYHELKEAESKVRQAAEFIQLMGFIPGQCDICNCLGK